jgi:hypothetical protein
MKRAPPNGTIRFFANMSEIKRFCGNRGAIHPGLGRRVSCHHRDLEEQAHHTQHERGIGRFGPVDEAVVERLKTHVCQVLVEGDNIVHSIRFLF